VKGKVALVTGGNSGIGRATAECYAARGASVVLAARRVEEGEAVARGIRAAGGEARFIAADVSQAAEVERLVEQTVEAYGQLDYAFNNAGGPAQTLRVQLHEYPEKDWNAIIDVHLKGIFLCMKYEIRKMLEGGGGAIVNMSSVYGLSADPATYPSYVAAKHGAIGLTRSAAVQYATRGIRVNAICPGVIETPMLDLVRSDDEVLSRLRALHPMGRFGTVEEVAEAVLWLCSDAASFMTGSTLTLDGGNQART